MKSLFLLLSLAWFGTTFAQDQYHFLLTANSSIRITDPICKEMAEKSKEQLLSQIKQINRNQKKKGFEFRNLTQQAYFEMIQSFGEDPDDLFPAFPLSEILFKTYRASLDDEMYFSMQKATLKSLGSVDIEIYIKNVQVSSSETALDIEVRNVQNPGTPPQTTHFSCPTGRMLLDDFEIEQPLAWLGYWMKFYSEVKARNWLEQAIMKVEPKLVSKGQKDIQTDEIISSLGLNSKERLTKSTEQARLILKDLPYHVPFDEIVAVLVSQDEQKLSLLTYHQYPSELYYEENYEVEEDEYSNDEMTKWNFEKKDGQWSIFYSDQYTDSIDHIRSFYAAGFDSENRFKEETWIERIKIESLSDEFRHIELVCEAASPEIESMVRTEIQPKLRTLINEKGSPYVNFYQRISPQYPSYWEDQELDKIYFQDVLISNPEKTAFIFPVLLATKEREEYESTDEEFKFYVLLKNTDGSYKLYDWYYFKPFSYWGSYSLLRCAESHLGNISTYTSDQKVINDSAFWNNYLFKKSARGYDYLSEVVTANESISLTRSEFDATVQDCINILLEYDVVDLYDHQLKQIIRCINTIQKGSLSGTQNVKLITLSQELHFQKRLNKIQKADGNYYPALSVFLGMPLIESSYYQIR
jgi:hypothetical protein